MRSIKEHTCIYIIRTIWYMVLSIIVAVLFITFIGMGMDVMKMGGKATQLKAELGNIASCIKDKNFDGADLATKELDNTVSQIDKMMSEPTWRLAASFPFGGEYIQSVDSVIDFIEVASDDMIKPAINVMQEHPLDSIKVGDEGFNTDTLVAYIALLEDMGPAVDQVIGYIESINLPASMGPKISEYTDKLVTITSAYEEAEQYLPLLKSFLGGGSDRTYLLAAQNSAEVRASGGFPGSIGTIVIQDGILTIGDFKSVYDVLPYATPTSAGVTRLENEMFGYWMNYPRDACYNPDFERVASIWALSYESKYGKEIDGVVSLTPSIIQRLLRYIGEVTLSDGTVLNGDNATKTLQHDLYYKYYNESSISIGTDDLVDSLFAETAKVTMSRLVDDFSLEKIAGYLSIFNEGVEDRTIMMWMADEEEESYAREVGCSGGLNSDADKPDVGVYISSSDPCKLGWYIDMDVEVEKTDVNDDGTNVYDVTVTLENIIDDNTIKTGSYYILGTYGGTWKGFIYLFAPSGGTIGNFESGNKVDISKTEYHDLEVGYSRNITLYPNTPITITYQVTTAEGVTAVPGISQTPTLTQYR